MIYFHGVSSDTVRVIVESYPSRPIPQRRSERFTVPGRSGDVIAVEDAFENVKQSYDIYLSAEGPGLPQVAERAARWLMVPGYQTLEDEYDTNTFRLAMFLGPVDLQNVLNMFGQARIEFDCCPQRYLKSGAVAATLASGDELENPTGFTSLPLITLQGSGAGNLTVGNTTMTISDSDGLVIDCREHEVYKVGSNINYNSNVTGDWPELAEGSTAISWTGGITGVTIVPRWYWI